MPTPSAAISRLVSIRDLSRLPCKPRMKAPQQAIAETLAVIRHFRQEGGNRRRSRSGKSLSHEQFSAPAHFQHGCRRNAPGPRVLWAGARLPDRYPDIIGSVTLEQVKAAAKQHLHPDQFLQVVVADLEKASLEQAKTNADVSGGNTEQAATEEPNPAVTVAE